MKLRLNKNQREELQDQLYNEYLKLDEINERRMMSKEDKKGKGRNKRKRRQRL